MKKITLTKGYEAMVDNMDYALALSHKWSALKMQSTNHTQIYATASSKQTKTYLHREIMKQILIKDNKKLSNMKGRSVFFKNGNSLDCTRSNLILMPSNRKLRLR